MHSPHTFPHFCAAFMKIRTANELFETWLHVSTTHTSANWLKVENYDTILVFEDNLWIEEKFAMVGFETTLLCFPYKIHTSDTTYGIVATKISLTLLLISHCL